MSIGSRIKELRTERNITQEELAKKIGVTKGAIANYENEVSSPKIELMYKLFDALGCDANYLHQDDMKNSTYREMATPDEFEKIIKKYRDLDTHGKEMVDFTLEKEYERSIADNNKIIELPTHTTVKAAHNDNAKDMEEQAKTQRDLESLKRPE